MVLQRVGVESIVAIILLSQSSDSRDLLGVARKAWRKANSKLLAYVWIIKPADLKNLESDGSYKLKVPWEGE